MTDKERFCFNHGYKQAERDFIKKLEQIRADINALYGVYLFKERLVNETDVMQIINNHISELKGENEK